MEMGKQSDEPIANISKMLINKRFLVSKMIHETTHSNIYLGLKCIFL